MSKLDERTSVGSAPFWIRLPSEAGHLVLVHLAYNYTSVVLRREGYPQSRLPSYEEGLC